MAMSRKQENIRHLQNNYVNEYNRQLDLKRQRKKYLRRRLGLISLVGFFLLLIPAIPLVGDYMRVRDFESQRAEAAQELEKVEDYQDDLEYYVSLLEDDEYVAKLARSEYYLSDDDEIIFNLPEGYLPDHLRVIEEFHDQENQNNQENTEKSEADS